MAKGNRPKSTAGFWTPESALVSSRRPNAWCNASGFRAGARPKHATNGRGLRAHADLWSCPPRGASPNLLLVSSSSSSSSTNSVGGAGVQPQGMPSALAALLDASITLSFVLFVLKASALVATRKQHADVPDDARKRKNLTAQVMDHVRGALVVLGVSTDEGNGVNAEPSLVARVGRYETRVHHFPGSVKAYASPTQLARWRAEPVNVQTSQNISATQDRREFTDEQHATKANAHVAEEQPREDDVTDEPSHAPAPAPAPVAQKPKQPETQRPPRLPQESQEKMSRLHFPGPVPQGALQAAEAARRATRRRRQRQCDEGAIRGPLGEFLIADDDEGDRIDESDSKLIAKSAAIASADTSNTSVSSVAPSLRSLIQ